MHANVQVIVRYAKTLHHITVLFKISVYGI